MAIEAAYTAEALSTGQGRDGHVRSSDGYVDRGNVDVTLTTTV